MTEIKKNDENKKTQRNLDNDLIAMRGHRGEDTVITGESKGTHVGEGLGGLRKGGERQRMNE